VRLIAEDFITSVKLRAMVPISQQTFTEANVLQVASEELVTRMVPLIMSVREKFFLSYKRTAITASKSRYTIAERAIGNALQTVWILDTSNRRLRCVYQTDVNELTTSPGDTGSEVSQILLQGDEIVLLPTPASAFGYVEQWYYSRPNQLVLSSSCAKITAVASVGGTTTFTVNTDLTGSLSVGSKIDIVSGKSPYLLWAEDATITAITSTSIAVATTDVVDEVSAVEPVANDYICPAKQSNIPNIPEEFHPVLAQSVAYTLLKSLGMAQKAAQAKADYDELAANVLKLVGNRVESGVKPVFNPSGIHSAIGSGLPTGFLR